MFKSKDNTLKNLRITVNSVLLFGVENDLALSAIRCLSKACKDLSIYTVSNIKFKGNVSEWSRYITKSYHTASTIEQPEELIPELKKIIELSKADIMIPIEEWHLLFISENLIHFKNLVNLPPVSKPEILNSVILKNRLSDTIKKAGLPFAITERIPADEGQKIEWTDYPCIMKPSYGYDVNAVELVNSEEEIKKKIRAEHGTQILDHELGYILQQYIPGYNIDCSFIAKNGEIKVSTVQRGIVDPGLRYSNAIKLMHSEMISQYVKVLIGEIGFEGIAHLDFRYDEREKNFKLIDFNARVWLTLLGSLSVGVNFMYYLILSAIDESYEAPIYSSGLYFAGKSGLRSYLSKNYRKDNSVNIPVNFDLNYRISDPVPELISVWRKSLRH